MHKKQAQGTRQSHDRFTAVIPENLTVKLVYMAYAPDLSCNLVLPMVAHGRRLCIRTEERGICLFAFHDRFSSEGDGLSYFGLGGGFEGDDD